MTKPILVVCVVCGVVFDLRRAKPCGNRSGIDDIEGPHTGTEYCFCCPLGHPGHDAESWWKGPRRPATEEEQAAGIEWMLVEEDVTP